MSSSGRLGCFGLVGTSGINPFDDESNAPTMTSPTRANLRCGRDNRIVSFGKTSVIHLADQTNPPTSTTSHEKAASRYEVAL